MFSFAGLIRYETHGDPVCASFEPLTAQAACLYSFKDEQ